MAPYPQSFNVNMNIIQTYDVQNYYVQTP